MSEYGPIFQPGDAVHYTGEKFKQELSGKEGKPFKGWIHAKVINQANVFVVWFPDTKESDSYIISAYNLSKVRPTSVTGKSSGPIVELMPNRRKKSEDDI